MKNITHLIEMHGPQTVVKLAERVGVHRDHCYRLLKQTPGLFVCGWERTQTLAAALYSIGHGPTPKRPTYTAQEYDARYRAKLAKDKPRKNKRAAVKRANYKHGGGSARRIAKYARTKTVSQIDPMLAALMGIKK